MTIGFMTAAGDGDQGLELTVASARRGKNVCLGACREQVRHFCRAALKQPSVPGLGRHHLRPS